MNRLSRPWMAMGLVFALTCAACGGASPAEPAAADDSPTAPAVTAAPTQPATDIAMVDSSLRLDGLDRVTVRAGETVAIDHLLYNDNASVESVALKLLDIDPSLVVALGADSLQMGRHEVTALTTSVVLSEDASPGDTFSFTVQAILASDIAQRSNLHLTIEVVDVDADRPEVTDNTAETTTNERVLAFVVGDDVGPDLDGSTLRVVAGAFRSSSTEAENGFVTYVPFANVTGPDALLYELCNGDGICDTGVLRVVVNQTSE